MVVEHFKRGARPVHERFRRSGRMLSDGVTYRASWIDLDGSRCYQLMDAPSVAALDAWTVAWSDLIDFEVVPVLESHDYWSRMAR